MSLEKPRWKEMSAQAQWLKDHGREKPKSKRRWRHGLTGTPLHKLWKEMIGRCYTKSKTKYPRYGGRGIKVCPEWRDDFLLFKTWAESNGYRSGLQIDRRDNDGNYEPENCRFVTNLENCQNRPVFKRTPLTCAMVRSMLRDFKGNISAVARASGISRTSVRRIIRESV